jgi:hypothetical protein
VSKKGIARKRSSIDPAAMHTVMVVGVGCCLLALGLLVGRALGSGDQRLGPAALAFVPLWLIGAAINMWIGVRHAAYSVAEEAPIFLIVFAIPTAIALLVRWKLAS